MITRCFKYFEYIFVALAFGSMIVYALAVLNSFYIDPLRDVSSSHRPTDYYRLHFNNRQQKSAFKLHLHRYACYDCNVGYHGENLAQSNLSCSNRIWLCGLMTADSDSGILGMAVFMIIYLVWFSNSLVRLKRFFLSATVMLLFAKLLRLFSLCFDDKSKGFDKFQEIFVF